MKRASLKTAGTVFPIVLFLLAAGAVSAQETTGNGMAALLNIQSSFRAVAQKVVPTVVEVNTVDIVKQSAGGFSPFGFFFRRPDSDETAEEREFRMPGLGSGVIVRRDGDSVYVVTNNHVAGEAEEISVTLQDGREFPATLVGADANLDLALLAFETKESVPLADLGDSEAIQVGDWAIAVGNPLGFDSTMTVGIISAIGRTSQAGSGIVSFTDYIQTDAAINQGNSGGALVDIEGRVVGINTWIASNSGGSIGLGFAIPVNVARRAIDDFLSKGGVEYGWLGVSIEMMRIPEPVAEDLKIEDTPGVLVHGIFEDSPAEGAGLQAGDYILEFNGEKVVDANALRRLVAILKPGDSAELKVVRLGKERTFRVKISGRVQGTDDDPDMEVWPGLSIVLITDQLREQLDISKSAGNILIGYVGAGSRAEKAGLRRGDIIQKINGKNVTSAMGFYELVNGSGRSLRFTLLREGDTKTITLKR